LGTAGVLILFGLIAWRGIRIALQAPDLFGRLLATGFTAAIIWQALVNVAVVTNTVPYTGVPLPFVSFGGSSIIISMFSMGVLLNISRYLGSEPQADLSPVESRRSHTSKTPRQDKRRAVPATDLLAAGAGVRH